MPRPSSDPASPSSPELDLREEIAPGAPRRRPPRVGSAWQELPRAWAAGLGRWHRRLAWHVLAAVVVATTALLLFAKVGEDVFEHESGSFDAAVRGWLLAHQDPILFRIFTWITTAGSTAPIVAVAAVVCLWLWRAQGRYAAAGAIAAPLVAVVLFNGVKRWYARVRPVGALQFGLHSYAFPSGHATVSMTAAVTFAFILWRERLLRQPAAFAVAIAVPLLVGFSRLYLDVHWATDVLGGWAIGLFVAALAILLYERLRRDPVVAPVDATSARR